MESSTTLGHSQIGMAALQSVQAENAVLRAELEALRSHRKPQALQPEPPVIKTFDLFGLPRELRDAIYEHCVVVGTVMIRRPGGADYGNEFDDDYSDDMRYNKSRDAKANVQLFQVNKQLRFEAIEMYLSKNDFILPAPTLAGNIRRENSILRIPGSRNGKFTARHLRSVSISLDSSRWSPDVTQPIHGNTRHGGACGDYHDVVYATGDACAIFKYHNRVAVDLKMQFTKTFATVLTCGTNLRRVQINLQSACYPSRCHRLVKYIFRSGIDAGILRNWSDEPVAHSLKSIDFLGTVNAEER